MLLRLHSPELTRSSRLRLPKRWGYRLEPPRPALLGFFNFPLPRRAGRGGGGWARWTRPPRPSAASQGASAQAAGAAGRATYRPLEKPSCTPPHPFALSPLAPAPTCSPSFCAPCYPRTARTGPTALARSEARPGRASVTLLPPGVLLRPRTEARANASAVPACTYPVALSGFCFPNLRE